MENALEPAMPTYSGGLGMLAGDTICSAADLKMPIVALRPHQHDTTAVKAFFFHTDLPLLLGRKVVLGPPRGQCPPEPGFMGEMKLQSHSANE